MAKAFVVIKNNTRVVGRYDTKAESEAAAEDLRDRYPSAVFEFGKLDKKLYTQKGETVYTPIDENL